MHSFSKQAVSAMEDVACLLALHEAYLLRLDSSAAAEKQAKMILVPRKAVTRIPGWAARTIFTKGPSVAPWKRAQPANSPYLHHM